MQLFEYIVCINSLTLFVDFVVSALSLEERGQARKSKNRDVICRI